MTARWAELAGDVSLYRVLDEQHHSLGEVVVLRRADGVEVRAYRGEVRMVGEDGPALPLTGRACRYCGEPIPWNPDASRVRNLEREFCVGHQSLWKAQEGRRRRAEIALTDPVRAARMERDSKPVRREREAARAAARAAAEIAPAPAKKPAVVAAPPEPEPVGPLMWRLVAAGEPESGCLLAGLTPAQVARVMALQRGGGRAAR